MQWSAVRTGLPAARPQPRDELHPAAGGRATKVGRKPYWGTARPAYKTHGGTRSDGPQPSHRAVAVVPSGYPAAGGRAITVGRNPYRGPLPKWWAALLTAGIPGMPGTPDELSGTTVPVQPPPGSATPE